MNREKAMVKVMARKKEGSAVSAGSTIGIGKIGKLK